MESPPFVTADEDGSFCLQAVFTAGPGGFGIFVEDLNSGNTTVEDHQFDIFCGVVLGEGEQHFVVNGIFPDCPDGISASLLDPAAEGWVTAFVTNAFGELTCLGDPPQGFGTTTVILPFEPPPIPTLSTPGFALLALVVAGTAGLALSTHGKK